MQTSRQENRLPVANIFCINELINLAGNEQTSNSCAKKSERTICSARLTQTHLLESEAELIALEKKKHIAERSIGWEKANNKFAAS